jgi:exodeoxyribonuclease III
MEQQPQQLKIFAWNPNGIKSLSEYDLFVFLQGEQPDILFFPECKGNPKDEKKTQASLETTFARAFPNRKYRFYWSYYTARPWMHGNAVAIRDDIAIDRVSFHLDDPAVVEPEGRVITLELANGGPVIVGLYIPNASTGLTRLDHKLDWLRRLRVLLDSFGPDRTVIALGDVNVAPDARDLCNPSSNTKTPGYSPQERAEYETSILSGYVDVWRARHPIQPVKSQKNKGQYTFWTSRNGGTARQNNSGWRLDAILVDNNTWLNKQQSLGEMKQCTQYMGSDHCPIGIILNL